MYLSAHYSPENTVVHLVNIQYQMAFLLCRMLQF